MRLGLTMVALLGLLGPLGCAALDSDAGAATDDFIDMDTPPGNCSAETGADPCPDPGASTGVPDGGACLESSDCANGSCVAPFVDGEVGDFVCVSECVPLMYEQAWCLDSTSCCDAGAVCNSRGLCVEGSLDDSGTAADSGTADGTGTDGTGTSGTTGSSEGTSSDTGASTGTTGTTGPG